MSEALTKPSVRRGFTLIELLIVVAIIAVLAAIAVPNFLEAQTRAKVSRTKSDLRAMAAAIESYRVDGNNYPVYGRVAVDYTVEYPGVNDAFPDLTEFISTAITTPIAYLSTAPLDAMNNPQKGAAPAAFALLRQYEYVNLVQHVNNWYANNGGALPGNPTIPGTPAYFVPKLIPAWGQWRLTGAGPDKNRGPDIKNNSIYDPTNGTTSVGAIVRSQTMSDSRMSEKMQ